MKEFVASLDLLGGKHSVLEACRYFAKKHPTRFPVKQVEVVKNELIEEKKAAGLSELYIADLNYRCGTFAKAFQCPIASVTKELVQEFLKGLKLSARSRNNFSRAIMSLFQFAKERGYLPKDHNEVEFKKLKVKAVQEEIEIFTPTELGKLLAKAPADFGNWSFCGAADSGNRAAIESQVSNARGYFSGQGERMRPRVRWSALSPTTLVRSKESSWSDRVDRRGRRSEHARARVLPDDDCIAQGACITYLRFNKHLWRTPGERVGHQRLRCIY